MGIESKYEPQGYCPKCNYRMNPGVCTECGEEVASDELLAKPIGRLGRFLQFANRHERTLFYLIAVSIVLLILSILWPSFHSSCVVEGTLVSTQRGEIPIENLRIGDPVHCRSPEGKIVTGKITAIREAKANKYLEFKFENESRTLSVTAAHPILTKESWQKAGEIDIGQMLVTGTGQQIVHDIRKHSRNVNVFDLTVEPFPNFVANGVIVHNKSYVRPPRMQELTGEWIAINESKACLYRFELHEDGTGTVACQPNDHHRDTKPDLFEITFWRVKGRDVEINLKPKDYQFLPTTLRGRVIFKSSILLNEVEGGRGNFAKELSLIREADVLRSIQTTRDAMSNGPFD